MTFEQLLQFVERDMQMAHVYQPVMLRTLAQSGGAATRAQIARALLNEDRSQLEYYEAIVQNMVGRVLKAHGVVEREGRNYSLSDFDSYTVDEQAAVIEACERRLSEYVEKRGEAIWAHRRRSVGYVSGTLRYEVLKAARFRCELCGCSADERALEVDHIVPRNRGGSDDLSNLQALCYSCNAMKRDRDDTDFRAVRASYDQREPGCAFCELPASRVGATNALAVAIADKFPVTAGHTLILPRRHVTDYFELGAAEVKACHNLVAELRSELLNVDPSIRGFNVGVNAGEAAGQTVMHCHVHLIPRRLGDVAQPRGGVRHMIPRKGDYAGWGERDEGHP